MRRTPNAPPNCSPSSASRPSATPVPADDVAAYGLESLTNLIVRRRHGDGPTIALNAHGDVVPPGDGWTHDPYGGEVADGKLYGRASAVSKSDFATYTFALRALEGAEPAAEGRGRAALHLRRGVRRRARTRLAAPPRPDPPDLLLAAGFSYQVVTAHNGCLQMEVQRGPRAPGGTRTHVPALRGRNLRR